MLPISSWKKRGKDHSGTNPTVSSPSAVRLPFFASSEFNGKSAAVNTLFGAPAHPAQDGGAVNFALGSLSGISSAAVNFSNAIIDVAYIRKWGIHIDNVSMPLSLGQNLNIATGGSASHEDSVIMKEQVLFNTTTNIVNEGTL